ncbi:hypothetical protein [Streptomyces sp. NPDC005209]|uniref:hypothetical protein n=1 Tax=Streptomyces sp. NPDC005209 TaxID=3156715 RepID=UPI0033BD6D66
MVLFAALAAALGGWGLFWLLQERAALAEAYAAMAGLASGGASAAFVLWRASRGRAHTG